MSVRGKTILVGVCGGIAAYKTCALVSKLVQNGATVHVMMTENATEFVAPLTFETLSHNRVVVNTFDRNFTYEVEHVSLAKKADAVVLAPTTANVIAKLAVGIADDFLTTTVMACRAKVLFAPAMNTAMLENPATVGNIKTLVERGYIPVYGDGGYLACGDVGGGRMAEPQALFDALSALFEVKRDFAGKTVLITSGATRADIDPVRYITNRSSGKMGYALACAAHERGAKVVYVRGYTDEVILPREFDIVDVGTTEELLAAVKSKLAQADYSIMAAAPCDYSVLPAKQKIKSGTLALELKKSPDCAAWAGEHKGKSKLVVFAAETESCEKHAREKLDKKRADMVVLNDVTKAGAGFDTNTNIATLITHADKTELPVMSKRALADVILDKLLSL